MALVLNGSTGITFPAGGTGNPAGTVVGTSDSQTLSNKTVSGNLNMTGGTKYQVGGVTTNALAWLNFNASTQSIRSSYNVSSVTTNGTGDYTINFTNAMTDTNYIGVSFPQFGGQAYFAGQNVDNTLKSTTQIRIYCVAGSSGYPTANYLNVNIAFFGN